MGTCLRSLFHPRQNFYLQAAIKNCTSLKAKGLFSLNFWDKNSYHELLSPVPHLHKRCRHLKLSTFQLNNTVSLQLINLLLLERRISVIKVLLCLTIYSLTGKVFMKKSLPSQYIKNMDSDTRDLQVSI